MTEEESLPPAELKIYRLLEHQQKTKGKKALTIKEISQKTRLFRSRIYSYIASMRKKGIDIVEIGGKYFLVGWSSKEKVTLPMEERHELLQKRPIFIKKGLKKIETFADILRKNIAGYDGIHSDVLKHAPQFFELFQNLSGKRDLDANTKRLVNSVVSYFVLPQDVIPEDEWGAFGYIDDLYLSAYVVNELKDNEEKRKLIEEYWRGKEDVFELAVHVLKKIKNTPDGILEKALLEEVLDFVGLKNKELDDAEIKKIWGQRPSEERICYNCGKELSPYAQPWNKYCDICAEEVYGPAKLVTNEIKELLLKIQE